MSNWRDLKRYQKIKVILVIVFFVLILIILIISFSLKSQENLKFADIANLGSRYSQIRMFVRVSAMVAMLLFFSLLIMYEWELTALKKSISTMTDEMHLLKSKLYDYQEKEKKALSENNEMKKGE